LLENDEKRRADTMLFTVEGFEIMEALGDFKKANLYPSVLIVVGEIRREKRELDAI
jgi:hypothetical protein